ncbi:NADPH:quinone oxidoreductase [Betaproteobacteria bacterium GR16-43]|nr:NADPH:quinone oxidoreductase [Betaproteobacteria bacterium GR16-43]
MKAVICSKLEGPAALAVGELPDPKPGPGQVVVEVRAASLNFPDALMVRGMYQVKPPLPFSPGAELAGIVRAVGEGVERPRVGDSVIGLSGHGACAQLCVVDAARTMPLPEGIGFDDAAAFALTYGTALHALREVANLQPGETLAVLGASGGTGIAAIECGKAMGARVIACASSEEKLALCRKHGADETIDYLKEDLRARLDAIAGKKGVDVVFDAVGGPHSEPALRATGWRGRFLVIGFAAGEIPKLPLNLALLKERQILGVYWGDWTRKDPAGHARNMKDLVAWMLAGKVRPAITERVGLEGVADAIARMSDRKVLGKVVVNP